MTDDLFKRKAPGVMGQLVTDFQLSVDDAAAILGNLGHECVGFTKLQEMAPTVKGSRGGYGWPQWTGPRRRAFEAYCKRANLDPASDKAQYAYLFVELKGAYAGALDRLRAARNLDAKVIAFELAYEGAGVKHYPSRQRYARVAREAYLAAPAVRVPDPTPAHVAEPPPAPGWFERLRERLRANMTKEA